MTASIATTTVATTTALLLPSSSCSAVQAQGGGRGGTTSALPPAVGAAAAVADKDDTTTTATTTSSTTATANDMYAPKFVQTYDDFTRTPQGWSYRDVTKPIVDGAGIDGGGARIGDRVVYEWSGYTIGYFGRPFQARNGPRGGAFEGDGADYSRTVLGSGTVIKGLEQSFLGMTTGTIRQVLVPYGGDGDGDDDGGASLSYPPTTVDPYHERIGPKPTTFSGMRALNFVLDNPRVDRTLLFNIKIVRIDRPDGKGGFIRG